MTGGRGRAGSHDGQNRDTMRNETSDPARVSRRDVLRGGAVLGGTLVWAAPTVQSIGMRAAFAQENGSPEVADFCAGETGRITRLICRYTAKGCDHLSPSTAAGRQLPCDGDTGSLPVTAYVVVDVGNCGGGGGSETFAGWATAFDTLIDTGIPRSPQACTRFRVYTDDGRTDLRATEVLHTSCSAELNIGEQYGPVEIYDGDWDPS
jgi:hypothetical protein